MRQFIRPATPEEESAVGQHIETGETLLGVHDDQNLYAIRQPDGAVRYLGFEAVAEPGFARRVLNFLGF